MRFTLDRVRRRAFLTGFAQQNGIVLRAEAGSFGMQAFDVKSSFIDCANQGGCTGSISGPNLARNPHALCENDPDQRSVDVLEKNHIKYRKFLILVNFFYKKSLNVNYALRKFRVLSQNTALLKLPSRPSFSMKYALQESDKKVFNTYFVMGAN
jgi:hypothetical protein